MKMGGTMLLCSPPIEAYSAAKRAKHDCGKGVITLRQHTFCTANPAHPIPFLTTGVFRVLSAVSLAVATLICFEVHGRSAIT
jgi:hypothetical protein